MAWEYRKAKLFYYRKKRVGPRVISEYLGQGLDAEEAAALDAEDRAKRNRQRQALLEMHRLHQAEDQELDGFDKAVDLLITGHLLTEGYHQHRGTWRKSREQRT